jgi:tetratricopeptide (TPR) repeat protein
MNDSGPVTTAGVIAVSNLEARIEGQLPGSAGGWLTLGERAGLIDLIALRGRVLGFISDSEQAAILADELVRDVPRDGRSYLARAKMRAVFHRFNDALEDLEEAAALGGDRVALDAERAAVYQALGRYDDALALRRLAVDNHADFSALAALAGLHTERGDLCRAERWFEAATRAYHATSPFPLAILEFERCKLWMQGGDLVRALAWANAAVRRLPAFVPAQGHLAEIDAAFGDRAAAIARLRLLALASDDPDYATQLARLLAMVGATEEAQAWRTKAEARYEELLVRHRDAFADHAAVFWLTIGDNPDRALRLAEHNLSLRQTPRAHALVRRASPHVGRAN